MKRSGAPPQEHNNFITSKDNQWLKKFRAAQHATGPGPGDPIILEGPKMILEAARTGFKFEALLASASSEPQLERILAEASQTGAEIPRARILRTTDKLFQGVAGTETPQGVAALFWPKEWAFEDLLRGSGETPESSPLVVVIAGVQDPGNVGTIVRSAEAFGGTGVISIRATADPWSPKAIRASAGSAIRIPLIRGMAIPVVMAQLRVAGVEVVATTTNENATGLGTADLRGRVAIFIGNEGHGLPSEVLHAADAKIAIAIQRTVESLNAGVAASIVLYEAARQRSERHDSGRRRGSNAAAPKRI